MPFYMEVTGLNELVAAMQKLPDKGADVAALALYEGAKVVADSISSAVHGIATEEFHYTKFGTRLPSPEEKAILLGARKGVAKFKKTTANVNTSVGMQNSGYGTLKGKTKPIPQIANAINSGTSFMPKQPFVRKAARAGTTKAINAMKDVIEAEFLAMTKDNGRNKT